MDNADVGLFRPLLRACTSRATNELSTSSCSTLEEMCALAGVQSEEEFVLPVDVMANAAGFLARIGRFADRMSSAHF